MLGYRASALSGKVETVPCWPLAEPLSQVRAHWSERVSLPEASNQSITYAPVGGVFYARQQSCWPDLYSRRFISAWRRTALSRPQPAGTMQ